MTKALERHNAESQRLPSQLGSAFQIRPNDEGHDEVTALLKRFLILPS
jgi:hypothetical protein